VSRDDQRLSPTGRQPTKTSSNSKQPSWPSSPVPSARIRLPPPAETGLSQLRCHCATASFTDGWTPTARASPKATSASTTSRSSFSSAGCSMTSSAICASPRWCDGRSAISGVDYDRMRSVEPDAALGNGGLGRRRWPRTSLPGKNSVTRSPAITSTEVKRSAEGGLAAWRAGVSIWS
jgi:hypothetical protein